MKNKKTLVALLLVLVLSLGAFVSCNNATTDTSKTTSQTTSAEASEDVSTGSDKETAFIPEGFEWDKETFVILSGQTTFSRYYGVTNEFGMDSDELEESVLNTAIIDRNLAVEALLGIEVLERGVLDDDRRSTGAMYSEVTTQIDSGAADFDLIAPSLYQIATLAVNEYLYNLIDLENNQLEKSWWDKFFVDEVTMNDKLYFATGDIGFLSRASITCVYFNKETANQLELGDVYSLVREKKFTFDTLFSWMQLQKRDLDTNNIINYKDQFGMGGQHDLAWALFYGAGQNIALKDGDDNPYLTINTPRAIDVADKMSEILMDESFVNANDYWNDAPDGKPTNLLVAAFFEGRSLLFAETLGNIEALRDMDFDFGILPIPLYDENQDRYYSLLNAWASNGFGIPSSLYDDEAEDVAVIMNVLAAKGQELVTPAFIETTLKGQRLRDDDSEEMLDIIFDTIGCDIGHIFEFGDLGFDALHEIAEGQNLTTIMDSLKDKAESDIRNFIIEFNS